MIRLPVEQGKDDPNAGILMPRVLHYGTEDKIWSIGGRCRQFPPSIILTDKDDRLAEISRLIEHAPGCG